MTANELGAVVTAPPKCQLWAFVGRHPTVNPMGLGGPTVLAASLPDVQLDKAAGQRGGEVPPRMVSQRLADSACWGLIPSWRTHSRRRS